MGIIRGLQSESGETADTSSRRLKATRVPERRRRFQECGGRFSRQPRLDNGQTFRHTERILGVYNNGKNLILTLERKSWLIRFF